MCSNLPHLKILDLRDNKITDLPDELCLLRNLNRLDVSNNSISMLPVTLSSLAHLISLQVDGNPIKTIRRDIIQCGTTRILKTLHERALAKAKEDGTDMAACSSSGGISVTRLSGGEANDGDLPAHYPDRYVLCSVQATTLTPSRSSSYQGQQQQHQQQLLQQFQYQYQCPCPYPCHQQQQGQVAPHCCVYQQLRNCQEYDRQAQGHLYEPNMARLHQPQQQCRQCPYSNGVMYQQQQMYQQQFTYEQGKAVHPRWV